MVYVSVADRRLIGRDLTWYAKEKKAGLSGHLSERERQMLEVVRQQEQEMLLEQM